MYLRRLTVYSCQNLVGFPSRTWVKLEGLLIVKHNNFFICVSEWCVAVRTCVKSPCSECLNMKRRC